MYRTFDTHIVREEKMLDGMWDFLMDGIDKKYSLHVPGCWNQHPDFSEHRGTGTYSRKIYVKRDGNIQIEFKGVSHTADVYFDGEKIAHHYNAYTPFSRVLKNVKKGEHEISVHVDNRYGIDSALHIPNDYQTYGGINRSVILSYINDTFIKYIHFTPINVNGKWSGKTEICITNVSDEKKSVVLTSSLCGIKNSKVVEIDANCDTVAVFENNYEDVKPWSHEEPNLYYINAEIDDNGKIDDLIDRVGFRVITYDNRRFYINGKPVFFKGLNRHEDYAILCASVPLELMAHDLDMFEDLGANAVRTAHYPNDEKFLDLCDERGFFVWEENHARGLTLEEMQNPNFEWQCEECIADMIETHYNHPSIVIWAILNECASDTYAGRDMYKKQLEQIKSLDTTRPTTFASCKYFKDVCLDLPDVVSFNCYFYVDLKKELGDLLNWIEKDTEGGDKPFIVSEFGMDSIYGFRDPAGILWSEECEYKFLDENIGEYMNSDRITGLFIWMFADTRINGERFAGIRPKVENNKGIVDRYRRPKISYNLVKEHFKNEAKIIK
ncbi:MAG: beta-glucuronidase [Ruminococcaceae bacterium]|nr:beta-glucuronidase [Oscillospiraceae bacterium]